MLLEHNANLLMRDSNGLTAADLADKCGHSKAVDLLKNAASKYHLRGGYNEIKIRNKTSILLYIWVLFIKIIF